MFQSVRIEENQDSLRRVSEAAARLPGAAVPERLSAHSPSKKNHRFGVLRLLPLLIGFFTLPAAATLVVFEDGRHVRVDAYEVVAGDDGDRLSMKLAGGGAMTVSMDVVDRIVDDEYERPPAPARPADAGRSAAGPPAGASRSVRAFSEKSLFPSSPFSSQILAAAKEHRVDPSFIAAVIRAESNGVATAVSRKGARGLMQLMPATARRLGVKRPFDSRENIRAGAAYLAELASRYGETRADLVLAAYNAGERAVEEHRGVPPFRETREYVRRVLSFWGGAAHPVAAAASAF
jgi:hypothetical protein